MTELAHFLEDPVLDRLPVFPLPATVFFPGTELPLHVFEPRYRALVEHCLETDRALGVALLKPGYEADYDGRPPIFEVLGAGVIVDEERLPDGRWNILLRGTDRVKVVQELPPDTAFRRFQVARLDAARPVPGALLDPDTCDNEACQTLKKLALRLADAVPDVKAPLGRLLHTVGGAAELADQLACRLIPDPLRRQQILEETNVTRRLQRVVSEVAEVCLKVDPACRRGHGPAN